MIAFNVLVIGDACVDEYRFGSVSRLNPEAPVPILNVDRYEQRAGMVHNVAANLTALGAKVELQLPKCISRKIRYIDSRTGYQLLRVDQDVESEPCGQLNTDGFDAIVVSDYNKGFIRENHLYSAIKKYNGPVFIDTKKTQVPDFKNYFYKVNELESKLLKTQPTNLIVTCGANGCFYNGRQYQGQVVDVVDVCGAGDVFLAALAFGYLEFKSIEAAMRLANKCAAISCQHLGSYTLSAEDLKCVF
jgi:D-beta-D-heptose 7-phosphate kinase/D-beta-D-heptose 1-phosphate adenosyltransferase